MSKRPNQNTLSVLRKKIKEAQVKLKRANQKLVRSEKSAAFYDIVNPNFT